ncbi:pantetheine-phosphate adenylyltransferase [Lapidilactobacillus gannanensis]|jgi:pantetheine-phosphate adenylyltransferase|uniref:Phosphopantetheine adenylyltransferase n=1 Tax=Lapidilactobacillus gannanensis TaxID=2486002 RepID=A0ABW4BMZ1_9LACO|nr:pantetheine-phosphate adenylyltransferase [Lapidilactobacillus gannanensis]MCH4057439.1 pantetheine-phosphate adenylyltransferase [Lactobacillaceae bacterium]
MTKIALFAGSFDPFTLGHLATLQQALKVFDQVIIAVMTNNSKHYTLSVTERTEIIEDATKDLQQVRVVARPATLTTSLAQEVGAAFLVRGIRNAADLTYESGVAAMNRSLAPEIETILLLADPKLAYVSSSMIKEVVRFGGDVSSYLTPMASALLQESLRG